MRILNKLKNIVIVLCLFSVVGLSQSSTNYVYSDPTNYAVTIKDNSDVFKISVSVSNFTDHFKLGNVFLTNREDFQGVSGAVNFKLFRFDNVRISGDAEYTRAYITDNKINQIVIGPKVSYLLAGDKLELFGSAKYGYTEGVDIANTPFPKSFTKSYGFGGDVNLGYFFVRPLSVDFQYLEGFTNKITKLSSGVGVRF